MDSSSRKRRVWSSTTSLDDNAFDAVMKTLYATMDEINKIVDKTFQELSALEKRVCFLEVDVLALKQATQINTLLCSYWFVVLACIHTHDYTFIHDQPPPHHQ